MMPSRARTAAFICTVILSVSSTACSPHHLDTRPYGLNYTIESPPGSTSSGLEYYVRFDDEVDSATAEKVVRWHLERLVEHHSAWHYDGRYRNTEIRMFARSGDVPVWRLAPHLRIQLLDGSDWIGYFPDSGLILTQNDPRRERSEFEIRMARDQERRDRQRERAERERKERERVWQQIQAHERQRTVTLPRPGSYEEYRSWDGHSVGLWDGEGRWNPIFDSTWAARRWEQEQAAGVFSRELPRHYFTVPQGALVRILREVGDLTEVIVASPHSFNGLRIEGKTGWVPTYWLLDKSTRARLEEERRR